MSQLSGHKLDFEGAPRVKKTISATAGNVVTNLSPTAGKKWKVVGGRITVVCDATVANRAILYDFTDATNVVMRLLKTSNITASQTHINGLQENVGTISSSSHKNALADTSYIPLPTLNIVQDADQFRITLDNGVAGDSYSGYIILKEVD